MRSIAIVFFQCLFFGSVYCQTISGYIRDATSKEPLIGAIVSAEGTTEFVITNKQGYFHLETSGSITLLLIRHIGYKETVVPVSKNQQELTVLMEDEPIQLESLEVTGTRESDQPNIDILDIQTMKELPTIMGEVDVMRSFQHLPGIMRGQEGTSGLYVRGGSPDQNLILLDDVPLYYVNHIGGFFSTFDPNAVKSARLIKGGFPAKYGGRLSSILDVTLKEGNKTEHRSILDIGLLSARYSHEGPIKKDKSSFLFSVRRSNLDLYSGAASLISSGGKFRAGYTFYDINTKYHHHYGNGNDLYISFYRGFDTSFSRNKTESGKPEKILFDSNNLSRWGSTVGSIKWTKKLAPKLLSNSRISSNVYTYKIISESSRENKASGATLEFNNSNFISRISDVSASFDVEWFTSSRVTTRAGTSWVLHEFQPGKFEREQKLTGQNPTQSAFGSESETVNEFNTFSEVEYKNLNNSLTIIAGVHLGSFHLSDKSYSSLQPRSLIIYEASDRLKLNASYGRMTQFLHLLSNSGSGLPVDLWVPSTKTVKPQNAHTSSIGAEFSENNWVFSADIFYKKMSDLIEFKDGASFFSQEGTWEDNVEIGGRGFARGLETQINKSWANNKISVAYTWSKNQRRFNEINEGNLFPYRYDRRHGVSILLQKFLTVNRTLSATWEFFSGEAITITSNQYDIHTYGLIAGSRLGFDVFDAHQYSSRNGFRLPAYHRLDIGYNIKKKIRRGTRTLRLGVYNAYNRKNPYFVFFDRNDQGEIQLYKASVFPIIPSVSWTIEFD